MFEKLVDKNQKIELHIHNATEVRISFLDNERPVNRRENLLPIIVTTIFGFIKNLLGL
jgi:hypothetical protein